MVTDFLTTVTTRPLFLVITCSLPFAPISLRAISLFQKATILGYKTHAEFVLDMRMAKSPDNVKPFLEELAKKLQPLKAQEMELFLQYKKEDVSTEFYSTCVILNVCCSTRRC